MVIVQGPVLGRIGKKYSSGFLTVAGSIILGTSFILLMSGNEIIIYLAAVHFAIGNGVMWPSVLTILSIVAGAQYQGYVTGICQQFGKPGKHHWLIVGWNNV